MLKPAIFSLCFLISIGVYAKSLVYVSDEVEIPVRAEKNSRSEILKMAPSGEVFELLEKTASGWTKIKTPEGYIGWIGSRYLMNEPASREQLKKIKNQYAIQTISQKQKNQKIIILEKKIAELQQQQQATLISKAKNNAKIEHIEQTYQDSLKIEHQNQKLNSEVLQLQAQIKLLENNNLYKQDKSARNWFIVGALVLFFGAVLGWLLKAIFGNKKQNTGYL